MPEDNLMLIPSSFFDSPTVPLCLPSVTQFVQPCFSTYVLYDIKLVDVFATNDFSPVSGVFSPFLTNRISIPSIRLE